MLEIMSNEAESSAKIIVIGVGGAGNNAVNRMVVAISDIAVCDMTEPNTCSIVFSLLYMGITTDTLLIYLDRL